MFKIPLNFHEKMLSVASGNLAHVAYDMITQPNNFICKFTWSFGWFVLCNTLVQNGCHWWYSFRWFRIINLEKMMEKMEGWIKLFSFRVFALYLQMGYVFFVFVVLQIGMLSPLTMPLTMISLKLNRLTQSGLFCQSDVCFSQLVSVCSRKFK